VLISHGIGIIFPELIELIRGYKMILNSRDNYAAFPIFSLPYFQKEMKNSYMLRILCVTRVYLSESKNNFFEQIKLVNTYKTIVYYTMEYPALKTFATLPSTFTLNTLPLDSLTPNTSPLDSLTLNAPHSQYPSSRLSA
jgi:hypothetical protein